MRFAIAFALLACLVLAVRCGKDATPASPNAQPSATVASGGLTVALEKVASGFTRPTFVTAAGDGSGRLFVVEKAGLIRVVSNGVVESEPFLDVRPMVTASGDEQGLLGLAFHPKFSENGRFFVTYTAANGGANTLAEYRASGGASADPSTARVLLAIPDTRPNHNGGMVAFGRDGFLYLSTGDGGGSGDPDRTAQDRNALLGKLLRLDMDGAPPYAVPRDNPFAGQTGARGEVWAYGLRNPWRFSFDRASGDLWIGDVGQDAREEIDLQPAASRGGENYGWSVTEGTGCYRPATGCSTTGFTAPIYDYGRDGGACSVTGGYVYHGKAAPALTGRYVFADYCQSTLQTLRKAGDRWIAETIGTTPGFISSFGEDEAGELYLVSDRDGGLYRIVAGR